MSDINQHKRMAMGESIGEDGFGVQKLDSMSRGNGYDGRGAHSPDHRRGARPPVGYNQANPDHGEFK
jgi:hypothetical protein